MSLFKASYAPVTVKLLLMKTSGRGRARLSALHMVAMADESICAGILELLLEHGADVNARVVEERVPGWTPLHWRAPSKVEYDLAQSLV